jgi:molecular chaperone DnaJ
VSLRTPVACETCEGSGAAPGTTPITCSSCNGTGEIRRVRQSILGQMVTSGPCSRCGGLGQEITSPCGDCRGDGRRTEERSYTVDIPGGVDNGNTLRVAGRGAAGPRGGPPGDLYVHIRVKPHDRFVRDGADLVHVLHVPMTQAALGAALTFATLDGDEDLVLPAGTQTGRDFKLRGRGVPYLEGRGRGDLIVRVVVDTPTRLARDEEDLLRKLAAERGEDVAPPDSSLFSKIRSAFK